MELKAEDGIELEESKKRNNEIKELSLHRRALLERSKSEEIYQNTLAEDDASSNRGSEDADSERSEQDTIEN